MIEVELRSFISEGQFNALLDFFASNSKKLKEDDQVTHYFEAPSDLRIQKNRFYSKVWLKKGNLHDDSREEIEIRCKTEDFENLEQLFSALGYPVSIKWFRKRHEFDWEGITVCLDFTKGYGYIIEFEKMCLESEKEQAVSLLREKCASLGILPSKREEFDERFRNYKEHWKTLTSSG